MLKRIIALILCLCIFGALLSGCFFRRCASCGNSTTRTYYNSATNKNEPYCSNCSRYCIYCGSYANKHFTGNSGKIIFVCSQCYATGVGN